MHDEDVRKRSNQLKIADKEYILSDLDTRKEKIIEELKNVDYNDLENRVFRMELTYHEVVEKLDTN